MEQQYLESTPQETKKKKKAGPLTNAHRVFIREMIKGRNQADAYITAYPGCSRPSAYTSASRLMDKTLINDRIEEGRNKAQERKQQKERKMVFNKIKMFKEDLDALRIIIHTPAFKEVTSNNTGKVITEKLKDDPAARVRALALNLKYSQVWERLIADASRLGCINELADLATSAEKQPVANTQTLQAATTNDHSLIDVKKTLS